MKKRLKIARLVQFVGHRRIVLFWSVAAVSLVAPWGIRGCQLTPPMQTASYENCAVRSIYDGDTMTVSCAGRMKVRLYCIDAPEMGQKPWGRQSRDYLREITPPEVRLVAHGHDRYGRTVAEVFAGAKNLNLEQVRAGRAANTTPTATRGFTAGLRVAPETATPVLGLFRGNSRRHGNIGTAEQSYFALFRLHS